jgi:hypothetical protein
MQAKMPDIIGSPDSVSVGEKFSIRSFSDIEAVAVRGLERDNKLVVLRGG